MKKAKIRARQRVMGIAVFFSDKLLPFLFFMLIIFGFDKPYMAVLTILTALAHELAHLLALALLSGGGQMPRAVLHGFKLKGAEGLSYGGELILILSGPVLNILLFLLLLPCLFRNEYLSALALLNLFTAIASLAPIEGYDGYGAIVILLKMTNKEQYIPVLDAISFLLLCILCFLSLYFIEKFNALWWIFATVLFSLLSKAEKFSKYAIFEN